MPARRLAARWVLPVESRPIERGAILIGTDGRLASVGPEAAVPRPPDVPCEEFREGLLLPGLVNTHTHLELDGLEYRAPAGQFAEWIWRVRQLKAGRTAEQFAGAARAGLAACYAAGVTTIADTGDTGAVVRALAEAGGSGVCYQEVFGPDPSQLTESMSGLHQRVTELASCAGGRVGLGVSPHAPYTVSGPLYAAVARWARAEGLPIAVHVAESRAESDLLLNGRGSFADAWRGRGIPLPNPLGCTPVGWLDQHGVLTDKTLCIHSIQVGPDDLARLTRAGVGIAHCPLSNLAHGHGEAPLARFIERGIPVGLGTDSVLSVGRMDLLAEARAARQSVGLDAVRALALATLDGARAIGLGEVTGSLRPGKWGDCVVIRPPPTAVTLSPEEQVLASGPRDVIATFLGGHNVYRSADL